MDDESAYDVNKVYSGRSLKAADLGDREPSLVIAGVTKKTFDGVAKFVLSFEGSDKTFVVNKTNSGRIAKMYGSNALRWVGKKITLYVDDEVQFGSDIVSAIRVRVQKAAPKKPEGEEDFNDEVSF